MEGAEEEGGGVKERRLGERRERRMVKEKERTIEWKKKRRKEKTEGAQKLMQPSKLKHEFDPCIVLYCIVLF